ncbi:MAG TPA: hypothetical protein VN734_13355 [Acidobacteriaceae bacterium]|nr:hypothetical protein [Acidobacteriaceae bacterium]
MVASVDSFYRVVTEAINDILEHGYDSQERLEGWLQRLSQAAKHSLVPLEVVDANLRKLLLAVFARTTRADKLMRLHRGVSKYTIAQVQPKLRAELDRRILASAQLIKLHREQAIAEMLRRAAGWMTSVPKGGTDVAKRGQIRKDVRKSIAGLSFIDRRVVIDQGHKLSAAVNEIVATDGGAIAAIYHSHWRESGYDYRPEHKARDGKIFLVRDSWAHKDGLVKAASHEYTDEIDAPAHLPYCRCYWEFLYSPSQLPSEMLTQKGREKLAEVRKQMASFSGAMTHAAHG